MDYSINLYQRPGLDNATITEQVAGVAEELVGKWFTPDVPDGLRMDLKFQDVLCLEMQEKVVAFIVFTSQDGAINLNIVGVKPSGRGNGYGSRLIEHLFKHVSSMGFNQIELLTIPPEEKPQYAATVRFYQKHGFEIEKKIAGLWQSGSALKLVKQLKF